MASPARTLLLSNEFLNESANTVRITIEGPTSVIEALLTPLEFEQLRITACAYAVWREHVPATNEMHNPDGGLIAGFCLRCRTPWPCKYSPEQSLASPEVARG